MPPTQVIRSLDPIPDIDPELTAEAAKQGLFPVLVTIFHAETNEETIGFVAYLATLPEVGARIELENGQRVRVLGIDHKVIRTPSSGMIQLIPAIEAMPRRKKRTRAARRGR